MAIAEATGWLRGSKLRLALAACGGIIALAIFLGYLVVDRTPGSEGPGAADADVVGAAAWQTEAWEDPRITGTDDGGNLIVVDSPPAGLYLRHSLDPTRKYRVAISGEAESGTPATLRIRIDDQEPRWLPAPLGSTEYVISDGSKLELLIYGDSPFSYRLRSVAIEECRTCLTDAELKENILQEIPGLDAARATDPLLAAELLTDWVARQVDLGAGTEQDWSFPVMSAAQIFTDVWAPDAGGGSCGAFAVFNDKILKLFGLNSFTINFGTLEGQLTHVSTILAVEESKGNYGFYLFDPTFDGTYRRSGADEYLDFATVLVEHSQDQQSFEFSRRPFTRTALFTAERMAQVKQGVAPEIVATCAPATSSKELFVCPGFDYLRYFDTYSDPAGWASRLPRYGIAEGEDVIATLMMSRVFSIGEAADPAATKQFRNLLSDLKIPYGLE